MKKIFSFLVAFIFIFNIFPIENIFAKNYLLLNKNYYQELGIDKGFLDEVISEENVNSNENGGNTRWQKFQNAVTKNLVNYTPGMTYNEYFLANNISPEDAFKLYIRKGNPGDQEVLLPSGGLLTSDHSNSGRRHNGEIVDYITYVGPYKERSAYWGDNILESPVLFSRLTVGNKLILNPVNSQFSNQIGYGEDSTINDYMMTSKNNFIIPARYNEERSDLFLTMRSAGFFGNSLKDARAFLSADSLGNQVVGKNQNSRFYLMTNNEILYTPFAYDQLGTFSKILLGNGIPNYIKTTLQNVAVNSFANVMNNGFSTVQNFSSANDIKGGNGGQIQIIGFYREGIEYEPKNCSGITNLNDRRNCLNDYLNNYKIFSSLESEREIDSEKIVNVKYYMYTNSTPAGSTISTPLASNGKHLYSPNESTFKIEITRPFFKGFGDFNNEIFFNEENFDEKIGEKSFEIEDNGVLKDTGEKISVDKNRVRVRISEDNGENYLPEKYTIEELKQKLEEISQDENNIGKIFKIAYTYSAVDSENENIGLLPKEIKNNTGAYAIPFVRNIYIPSKVIVKHIDENGNEFANSEEKILGRIGEDYTTDKKDFEGYDFEEIKDKELGNGIFKKGSRTIIYKYKKIPENGKIFIKYVNENGEEILPQEEKIGKIGEEYSVLEKNISDYEFIKVIKGEKIGNFEKDDKTIIFEYKKIEKKTKGTVFIKFLDENNNEIFATKTEIGDIGTSFNFSPENIDNYEFIKIFDGDLLNGNFTEKDQEIRFIYKKKETSQTNPVISENGKIIIKYVDEAGNEIESEVKEGKIGEKYNVSEKNISSYEFVRIKDGDSNTGEFEEKEKIITFIYKKIEDNSTNPNNLDLQKIIIKYVDEAGNEIESESKEGKIGEEYSISEKNISGYEFIKIKEGDSKTGNFEKNEKIITFIYKKINIKTDVSGNPPIIPDIPDDPRVIDNIREPKKEEPVKEEEPKKEEPAPIKKEEEIKLKPKKRFEFEPIEPISLPEVETKIKVYPKKIPKTGTFLDEDEIYKKAGIVGTALRKTIETKLPDKKIFRLAGSTNTDLKHWLEVLDKRDRNKNKYLVLPKQGLVIPVNTVSEDSKIYDSFINGKEEYFKDYLLDGSVELPGTSVRGYGENGNKVIGGHSSYWKTGKSRYKTHFQKIIGMGEGEEIWIYEKNEEGKFERYVYKVRESYNTDDEDISVLKPTEKSVLTLFTCTPIGGSAGRWIVKSEFVSKD